MIPHDRWRGLNKNPILPDVVNQIPAMVAYWDSSERCVYANAAYLDWFGRTQEQMKGISLAELLGPIYSLNLPHIRRALAGQKQVFERTIPTPNGQIRESIATYIPDVVNGVVRGFAVHVADVTVVRHRERELAEVIGETIAVLEKTKRSFKSKDLGVLRERLQQLHRRAASSVRLT